MSRWLAYANPDLSPDSLTTLTIDTFEESESQGATTAGGQTVSIVKLSGSVSEKGGEGALHSSVPLTGRPKLAFSADDDTLAFSAISEGGLTYGAVAMTTRMGATRAFQATERLKEAGRIWQAKDGTLSIAGGQL